MHRGIAASLVLGTVLALGCGGEDDAEPSLIGRAGPPLFAADGGAVGRVGDGGIRVPIGVDAAAPSTIDAGRPTENASEVFDGTVVAVVLTRSVGGFQVPLWLYKGGFAPSDDDGLLPIPAQALKHRAANPDLWTRWRRTAKGVERMSDGEWIAADASEEFAPLPKGTKLTGIYQLDPGYYLERTYEFSASGTFTYCQVISLTLSKTRYSGTYEVDGYVLRLRTSGGDVESLSLVHDAQRRPNTMWIDDGPYKRLNVAPQRSSLSCP